MKPFGSDVPEVEISVEEMMATNVSFDLHDEADVTGENALPFGHQSHARVSRLAPFCITSYETTHIALRVVGCSSRPLFRSVVTNERTVMLHKDQHVQSSLPSCHAASVQSMCG